MRRYSEAKLKARNLIFYLFKIGQSNIFPITNSTKQINKLEINSSFISLVYKLQIYSCFETMWSTLIQIVIVGLPSSMLLDFSNLGGRDRQQGCDVILRSAVGFRTWVTAR